MNNIVCDLSNTNNVTMDVFDRNSDVFDRNLDIITNLESENKSLTAIIQQLIRDKEQVNNQFQNLQREYNILRNKTSVKNYNNGHDANLFFKMNFN